MWSKPGDSEREKERKGRCIKRNQDCGRWKGKEREESGQDGREEKDEKILASECSVVSLTAVPAACEWEDQPGRNWVYIWNRSGAGA